jgi:hypothetical protein
VNVREKIDHILLDFRGILNETQRQFIRDAILAIEVKKTEKLSCHTERTFPEYDIPPGICRHFGVCLTKQCSDGTGFITRPVTIGELVGEKT